MREDVVIQAVNDFFAQRVFGAARRSMFEAGIDRAAETDQRDREERRGRLQRSEDADPTDPFTQGLRDRYNELETARRTVLATIAELDTEDERDRDRPGIGDVDLLDALPHLAVNLHRAPAEALERLYSLTQFTIDVHYKTGEATLKVTLPAGHMNDLAETAEGMSTDMAQECSKPAGQSLYATCDCPRPGSYSIRTNSYPP